MDVMGETAPHPLAAQFANGRGYLAACTAGLPMSGTRRAVRDDLDRAPDPERYCAIVERSRGHFARLVSIAAERVAIGSQTSVQVALVAASLPPGAEVLSPDGEFSSLVLPFVQAGARVRTAPLEDLAGAVGPRTRLVAFSLVQSATGEVADVDAICRAAAAVGARTVCDITQAAGWLPVDATRFDAVVCHTYKWLCAPRGVAFLALSAEFARTLTPVQAGWYAGDDPWASCYGAEVDLAGCARRFDVSPAWQAFVGAEPALAAFADADLDAIHRHDTGLAAAFRERVGLASAERPSAIVTWDDPEGDDLARLQAAGLTASGRNGRARVAFHVFNDDRDLDEAVAALRG
ncbi:aminotransferase class V-fold PLP-dependent enzyme [Microbacterium fluvii]|uniref:Aminotransferase class V-fold PLP-dependent enzyme n=1 Tax=Microbacterium fluvii TaxID=415215 RepID=A0ABW2HCD1_9MICO|nr:aminotransferase class V-fold PLP-dependent enzyme [Microbacterium fluvii]MCU4672142.1 aminotransferase class V-fold PLP-dependent enzyme [Microbacterium fluvii]